MAYIGKQPVVGNFVKLDAITTSATATYNLTNGGVAYFPQTANNCIVSLNGVIQSPTSAYTISGSTIVFSDALTASDSIDFILVLGDVLSIGTPSDGTITSAKLASGVSGLISWQSVQTTGFTASAGRGYPCNTTSAAFTVTLPASPSVGDTIILLDYAGTFATNNITLGANSNKINGVVANKKVSTNREAVTLVYVDSTQGWVSSSGVNEGTQSLDPTAYSVDFLVIAGGGQGGGANNNEGGGGGGGGGYRNSYSGETSGRGSTSETELTFNPGTVYTITVGAGGSGTTVTGGNGNKGNDSSISGSDITTITSIGGGGGVRDSNTTHFRDGGCGGGGGSGTGSGTAGTGTANQGFDGGAGAGSANGAGAGGGAGSAGSVGNASTGGAGGNGLASSITGSSVTRGGGGGGGTPHPTGTGGAAGTGGGAAGSSGQASAGTANTGGGGGGSSGSWTSGVGNYGGAGGKGVVILRIPTANYSGTTTGSPTVTTDGSDKVIVFNDSGSITG